MALDANQQFQMDLETSRQAHQLSLQIKQAKLEAVRMAKETLLENSRSKPADAREVTAADIAAFAATLEAYVNA
jgi:hypothetical protein